jgi:hypothetical protein
MAKAKTLSDAIQNMIDNIDQATSVAGTLIKARVHEDFEKAAKTSVDKYYEYKNGYYTKHGRKHRLYKTYDVKTSIKHEGNNIVISAGIYMSSDPLEGLYHSNSSLHDGDGPWRRGGDVEAEYVFKNFISGQHPWTNAWPLENYEEGLQYKLIKSKPSPDHYLKNYRDKYINTHFNKHVNKTLDNLLKFYM